MTEQTSNAEIATVGQISSTCIMHAKESIFQGGNFGLSNPIFKKLAKKKNLLRCFCQALDLKLKRICWTDKKKRLKDKELRQK